MLKHYDNFINCRKLANNHIFALLKCNENEGKILQFMAKGILKGEVEFCVNDLLAQVFHSPESLEFLPHIKNLIELGWVAPNSFLQVRLGDLSLLELYNENICLTHLFLKLLEEGSLNVDLPEIAPYEDHLDYLKDRFAHIDILHKISTITFSKDSNSSALTRASHSLKLLEDTIQSRLKLTQKDLSILKLIKEFQLDNKEQIIFFALLKEEYSGGDGNLREMNKLLELVSFDEYDKIKHRNLLDDNSKLVQKGLIEYDELFGNITKQNGDLIERIRKMRKQIAANYGFLIPQIRIKDNLNLNPGDYEVLLKDIKIGEGNVMPDKFLAFNTGMVGNPIEGIPTKEPAFGMDALWIDPKHRDEAAIQGYAIIDPATVITTHLTELIKTYAEEFITKDEVRMLMDRHAKDYPVVVGEAEKIPMGIIIRVLRELLREKIPIRDLPTILESITDTYPVLQDDTDSIVDQVRSRLSRTITDVFKAEDGKLKIFTHSLATEQYLIDKLKEQPGGKTFVLHSNDIQKLIDAIDTESATLVQKNILSVMLVD